MEEITRSGLMMVVSDEYIHVAVVAEETSRHRSRRAVAIEHGDDDLARPVAVEQESGDEAGDGLAVQDAERELNVSPLVEEGLGDQPRPSTNTRRVAMAVVLEVGFRKRGLPGRTSVGAG